MNGLLTFTAIALVLAAGFGISMLLASTHRRLGWIETGALSWMLGTAFVTLAQWILGLLLSHGALWGLVMSLCFALGLLGWIRCKERIAPFPKPASPWEFAALAILLCQAGVLYWLATRQPYGCDGLLVWEIKARAAFLEGGIPNRQFFSDPMMRLFHPNYPLYLPLLESWLYAIRGECHQSSLMGIGPLFYLAGISMLGVATTRLTKLPALGVTIAILPFFLPFVFQRHGGVLTGYADWPLGLFYLAAIFYLLAFVAEKEHADLRLFLACSMVIPWVKAEGRLLWLWLMLSGILLVWKELKGRALLLALPGGIIIALWAAFQKSMDTVTAEVFLPMNWETIQSNQTRIGPILEYYFQLIGSLAHWSLFFPLLGLAILYLLVFHREKPTLFVTATVVVPLLLYPGIYVFSVWDFQQHLATSLPRLFFQLTLTGFLVIGIALGKLLPQRR